MDPKERVAQVAKTKADARAERASSGNEGAPGGDFAVTETEVERVIENWPASPKKVAQVMVERYGLPNEVTPTLLVWHDSGPWKRTIITSDETAHDFPTPHTDYISQTINYDVPVERLAELAEFDGSLFVNRTAGQVTFCCDNEESNFLAANLMHDILEGKRSVADAREALAQQKAAWAISRPAPYTEGIRFPMPDESQTGHRDEPIMKRAAVREAVEKVKGAVGLGEDR